MSAGRSSAAVRFAFVVVAGVGAALLVFFWSGAREVPAAALQGPVSDVPAPAGGRVGELGPELPGLRTRTSRTYAAVGGDRVAQIFPGPVNYRDAAGGWEPIDSSLVASSVAGYAVRNRANDWGVDLPEDLAGEPVRLTRDGLSVRFSLEGAAGAPTVQGATARYDQALPGVDVRYDVLSQALKETLVLADRGAGSSFRFSLQTSAGVTAREVGGGVEFVRDGVVEMVIRALHPGFVLTASD